MSDNNLNAADKNVDGVMDQIRKYMALREQQAVRMNPSLNGVITDLVWIQLKKLSTILGSFKNYGPEKRRVADVLAGWDDTLKREFFQPANQNSILHEISPRDEGEKKHKVGDEGITDLRSLYKALNPKVEAVVGLIETWIIWDLQDASDIYNFSEQVKRVQILRQPNLPEEFFKQYAIEMNCPAGEMPTQQDIFKYEFNRLKHILERFMYRLNVSKPHQMIIARKARTGASIADQGIVSIARHIRALELLHQQPADKPLDPKLIRYYTQQLGLNESNLTLELAKEYETSQIIEEKATLRSQLGNEDDSMPYDFKMTQEQELILIAKQEQAAAAKIWDNALSESDSTASTETVPSTVASPEDPLTMSGVFKLS